MEGGVLFLDDDRDVRESICDLVQHLARRPCIPIRSFAALVELEASVITCELAILDVNLGPDVPNGLDAYRWLRDHGFRGRVYFLTGHASSHPLVCQAREIGGVEVLQKPVGTDDLRRIIERAP